ncbi:Eukaryotic DNA topoisomerase I, catalytic core [Roseivivax jejudonensis]|uniref:DNA topoisomerase n=1 Tax=Roseivivax jejudonensis TaxID=1529041 RepID=A0A1X6ZQK8_9RHOB|nr:DNA topoisomerase IB [Roseivivax jejudonensis]SLN58726.1 Eukaryotic DNA topoisomerase I, catalytic core [Roseivivax jejudonensis]
MPTTPDLLYYPDSRPGIRRRRRGRGWSYIAPDGTTIDDRAERRRLNALAVPPAYEDVWLCPEPLGHLQATGRDARRRKQYRYHPDWTAFRAKAKFDHLADFGRALPGLRRRVLDTLREGRAGDHAFAIAAVLALLDRADLRVGNSDYTRENKTFGATTLRPRHLRLDGGTLRLDFPGKGGTQVQKRLRDRTLERTLSRLDDLPGPTLVSWIDEDGAPRAVTSDEVNAFLSGQIGADGVTAKTFRTWTGSVVALETALAQEKPTIKALAEAASTRLCNTPTIARNSYIHPDVVALTEESPSARAALARDAREVHGLRQAEAVLLHLIG